MFFAIGALTNPYFLTLDNLTGILQSVTFLGFLSIGVGLALIAGEIDISVGSIYALAAVVTALLMKNGYGVPLAIAGGLGVGPRLRPRQRHRRAGHQRIGGRGDACHARRLSRPCTLVVAGGSPVTGMPDAPAFFDGFGQGGIGGVSFITILFLVLALAAEIVLRNTAFGFRLLAIGSNPVAARLVGFHVEGMRLLLLVLSGLLAALSGVCSVAYLHTAGPTAGAGYELTVLAATIIGGVQLTGGSRLDRRRAPRPLRDRHHPESDRPVGHFPELDARGLRHRPDRCRDGDLADQARSHEKQPRQQSIAAKPGFAGIVQREEDMSEDQAKYRLDRRTFGKMLGLAGSAAAMGTVGGITRAAAADADWKSWVQGYYGKPVKIAVTCYNTSNPYFLPTKVGAEDAGAQLGIDLQWTGVPDGNTVNQIQQFQQLVNTGYEAIVVIPLEADAWIAPIKKATDAGVVVVTSNSDSPQSSRELFFGQDLVGAAVVQGEMLAKLAGNKGKVALTNCAPGLLGARPPYPGRQAGRHQGRPRGGQRLQHQSRATWLPSFRRSRTSSRPIPILPRSCRSADRTPQPPVWCARRWAANSRSSAPT